MPILAKPFLGCNFKCKYCYEDAMREEQGIDRDEFNYDLNAVEEEIRNAYEDRKDRVVIHGGEVTAMPLAHLERLLKVGCELTGKCSIQTNGYNITSEHIRVFKETNTSVGLSIDGPWPINKYRGVGTDEERKEQTEQIIENMKMMYNAGVGMSIISVIHDQHIENIELFKEWVEWLKDELEISSGRMNPVAGSHAEDIETEEFADWYCEMADFVLSNPEYTWQPFRDIVDNLLGLGTGTCSFTKCDIFKTKSARSIMGDGTSCSCLRCSELWGRPIQRADSLDIDTRYEILKRVEDEDGGCKDCEYWQICYGHCPSASNDWRSKSPHCDLFKPLYEHIDYKLRGIMPTASLLSDEFRTDDYELRKRGAGQITFAAMLRDSQPSASKGGPRAAMEAMREHDDQKRKRKGLTKSDGESTRKEGEEGHVDGEEHLDGDMRHVDSNRLEGNQRPPERKHDDGIEHLDGDMRHIDSNKGGQ